MTDKASSLVFLQVLLLAQVIPHSSVFCRMLAVMSCCVSASARCELWEVPWTRLAFHSLPPRKTKTVREEERLRTEKGKRRKQKKERSWWTDKLWVRIEETAVALSSVYLHFLQLNQKLTVTAVWPGSVQEGGSSLLTTWNALGQWQLPTKRCLLRKHFTEAAIYHRASDSTASDSTLTTYKEYVCTHSYMQVCVCKQNMWKHIH